MSTKGSKTKRKRPSSPRGNGSSKKVRQSATPQSTDATTAATGSSAGPTPAHSRRASVEEVADDGEQSGWEDEEAEEDEEAQLKRLSKKWTASIYAFYKPMPTISYDKQGRRIHTFHCMGKGCKHVVNRPVAGNDAGSTSNMRRHAKSVNCWGEAAVSAADAAGSAERARQDVTTPLLTQGTITAAFARKGKGKVTYMARQHTKSEMRAEIVKWVAASQRPFTVVEDEGFNVLMKTGRPELWIPSATTVARDVRTVFKNARKRVANLLQSHDGALSFTTDAWTSPNHRSYCAVAVHLEVEGVPFSFLLDVVEIAKSHSGLNLAVAFAEILEEFGIADKMLSITCDNASNNDTLVDELKILLHEHNWPGAANRTRCFLHIVNLVAKTLLRQFDPPKKEAEAALTEAEKKLVALSDELEDDEDELGGAVDGEDSADEDDAEGWVDEMEDMTDEELKEHSRDVLPVRLALVKVRKLAVKIIHSTTKHLPRWRAIVKELKKAERILPRDVTTRWNSTFDMLDFALDYRAAIDKITAERDSELRSFELENAEWEILSQLRDVLKILKDATLFFSRGTPNLAKVIPAMDHIDKVLSTQSVSTSFKPCIRAALVLAKRTLNRYYGLTDYSDVYRIAMVLHPQFKLDYFKRMKWPQEWIDTALDITQTEYKRSYASREVPTPAAPAAQVESDSSGAASTNVFDSLPTVALPTLTMLDELAAFLAAPVERPDGDDALKWWKRNARTYPRLYRMALDYLSIPATSVDVERVFSRGRTLLSHTRNRLSAQSTRALLCLGSWIPHNIVKTEDIMAATVQAPKPEEELLEETWASILAPAEEDL